MRWGCAGYTRERGHMNGLEVHLKSVGVDLKGTPILQDANLRVRAGEIVAVLGPSGSGKTTLLECVSGAIVPTTGVVRIGAANITGMSERERSRFRRENIGLMFQDPELLPELSAGENVALLDVFDGADRAEALDRAAAVLDRVGLVGFSQRRIDQVSGGERQRIALARALCRRSAGLLLADEPTASLDRQTAKEMADLIVSQVRASGRTAIIATHDLVVADACDCVVQLEDLLAAHPS